MMASLLERLRRTAARHAMWTRGTRIVAAVSGGSDSVALLFLLRELAAAGDIELAGLVHLDHQMRPDSLADAAFCRALADRLELPVDIAHVDVPACARLSGRSLEAEARECRYAFLPAAAGRLGAERVAVAHTRDDQAETVLLRLLRGSGTTGLRGILPVRGAIVRPALHCTRAELRAFLEAIGEVWRDDPTNADPALPRNRVRHELLPHLRRLTPAVDVLLARTAEVAQVDEDLLSGLASDAAPGIVRLIRDGVALRAAGMRALPEALQLRIARRALETAGGGRSYGFEDARAVVDACRGRDSGTRDVVGLRMERSGADVVLLIRGPRPPADPLPAAQTLEVPGTVWLGESGPGVSAETRPARHVTGPHGPDTAIVNPWALALPLTVRTRLPGDRVRPRGVGGRKKLQDLFVDRKVPRASRDTVPIVCDRLGRIVWVAGFALDEGFGASGGSDPVIVLKLVPPRR